MTTSIESTPIGALRQFDAFLSADGLSTALGALLSGVDLQGKGGVGVLRRGHNGHGTWGQLACWDGAKWVHQGFTLEPRPTVGKGAIPLGDYAFNRWISPRLGKTIRFDDFGDWTNILIHVGNVQSDTEGCILAGRSVDDAGNPTRLRDSRVVTDWLYDTQHTGVALIRSR